MPQVWDKGRPPVWVFRARPYDPEFGIERNVWVASTDVESDEPFEGWLSFDGDNDVVRVPDDPLLDLDGGAFTIGVRFRTGNLQDASLTAKGIGATGTSENGGYAVGLLAGGFVRGSIASDTSRSNAQSSQSYADSQWHTLVYTWNGANHILFYDGVQVASVATAIVPDDNDSDLGIGASFLPGQISPSNDFLGDIERVVILDVANQAVGHDLLASRDLTRSVADDGPIANLVAAYPINEGHGTFVQDVSGNGHHGTLQIGRAHV